MKHASLALLLLFAFAGRGVAQSPDPTTELLKLQALFENISYTSFDVTWYYEEDNDTLGIQRDTLSGVFKVDRNRYYYMVDSVEQVQNDQYHTTIDHSSKIVYVERPYTTYTSVLQAKIMDSVFQEYYIDSMSVTDSSGYRKLKMHFKPESPYLRYELVYDLSALRLAYVKYTIKKEKYEPEVLPKAQPAEYAVRVRIVYSNFQTGGFTDSVFDTNWIFKRQNGVFVLESKPFLGYELANAYDEQ